MSNYILEYYQKIKDGSEIVGKWIKLIYEILIKGLENKSFFYSAKKANAAIAFIENFCRHHEGALAPNLIKLELWQKAQVASIFGIVDADGTRTFREVFEIVARKNGKTLLAAAIAAYCTFLDGEYGGRIYFAAPKLEQAALCFDAYYQIILQEKELSELSKKRRSDIYIEQNNTTAKALSFNEKKSDGLNISCCIADEIASWAPAEKGLKFYEVIKSSFGARRQPLLISMSTAGYVDNGIFDELLKRSTRFLLGDSKEKRLLPFLYMIDDIDKWNDINELKKSNPNLNVSVSVDYLLEEIAIAEGSLSRKSEFLCKYCNIKQNSSLAWLNYQDVDKASGEELRFEDFKDCYAVGGIDLSSSVDLTACCLIIERKGELYIFAQFFMPKEKLQEAIERDGVPYNIFVQRGLLTLSGENYVDYHDCANWFYDIVANKEIYPLYIGYDRYSSQYLISELQGNGFKCEDVFQGDNLWQDLQLFEGLLKDGKIHIGNNDLLKSHLLNSAIKMSHERGRGRLVKVNQTGRIDGTAAIMDALVMRRKYTNEIGEQLKNEGN